MASKTIRIVKHVSGPLNGTIVKVVEDEYGKQHLETVELHVEPDFIGGQGRVEGITPVSPR